MYQHITYNKSYICSLFGTGRCLGARQFFFYNHTIGPEAAMVLNHYMAEGLVVLLPWNLPVASQKDIRLGC